MGGSLLDGLDVIDIRDSKIVKISNWCDIDYVRDAIAAP